MKRAKTTDQIAHVMLFCRADSSVSPRRTSGAQGMYITARLIVRQGGRGSRDGGANSRSGRQGSEDARALKRFDEEVALLPCERCALLEETC